MCEWSGVDDDFSEWVSEWKTSGRTDGTEECTNAQRQKLPLGRFSQHVFIALRPNFGLFVRPERWWWYCVKFHIYMQLKLLMVFRGCMNSLRLRI